MAKRLKTYQQAQLQVAGYRQVQAKVTEVLGIYSLNTSQWVILGWLYERPDGMRISALAEVLVVEVPLVTLLLRELEATSMVTVGRDPTDGRARIVRLTRRALKLVPQLEAEMKSHLRPIVKDIPPQELQTYFVVLQRILQNSLA